MKLLTIEQLDQALEPVLRSMEKRGICLDVAYLSELSTKLSEDVERIKAEIMSAVGHEFNVDSPRQLAEVLYGELRLDDGEVRVVRTKTGKSTAAGILEKLREAHPAVPLILEYREKKKLLSTYVEPLPKLVDDSGRLHTQYRIDTAAGRLSSKNPNLQNIPVRTEEGREIRRAFVAGAGRELLAIDYSQIELRIAAHFSGDQNLIQAFQDGDDIHTATAEIMGVDRRVAKAINFGLLFGQAAWGLSEALNISVEDAQAFIDRYFTQFPKLAEWMAAIKAKAHETGYAETLLGRKRFLSAELTSKNASLRAFAERVAINHPIQGTEAEIVALAMIEIEKTVKEKDAAMLLQVHDELVFEVPAGTAAPMAKTLQAIMEGVIDLKVPIVTEAKAGPNWAQMEPVTR